MQGWYKLLIWKKKNVISVKFSKAEHSKTGKLGMPVFNLKFASVQESFSLTQSSNT